MNGFELNKIAASIFLAGIIAMLASFITDGLYHPVLAPAERGYQVEVPEGGVATGVAEKEPVELLIGALMAQADKEAGQKEFKKCAACHTADKGGANRVGPNLWDIVGNNKAHLSNYAYSNAISGKGGKWTYEELFHFLYSPRNFAPGTKMSFAGLKKPKDLANMIAYLRSLSDSPAALPAADAQVSVK